LEPFHQSQDERLAAFAKATSKILGATDNGSLPPLTNENFQRFLITNTKSETQINQLIESFAAGWTSYADQIN
jgi:hypothetical protein